MNTVYEFDRSKCWYDGKTLNDLLQQDESKFSVGMYERQYLANGFFVAHGNEILHINQMVECLDCHNVGYIDETEQYVLDSYRSVNPLPHFGSAPDDFDWHASGLKSADDADYFYLGHWVARTKEGKVIDCAEYSISERVRKELSGEAQKYFDTVKSKFNTASLNFAKNGKLLVWNMRDLVVPVSKGFLVRDVQASTGKLLYGQERGIQCPHCRTYLSTAKDNWDDDLTRTQVAYTATFDHAVWRELDEYEKWFTVKMAERTVQDRHVNESVVEGVRESYRDKIYDSMTDGVGRDMVYHTVCTHCGEEIAVMNIEEVAPSVSEVIPYLDADTAEMVVGGRFGASNLPQSERRIKTTASDFVSAWGELFGFGKAKEPATTTKQAQEEEKLPKGWKFVKA